MESPEGAGWRGRRGRATRPRSAGWRRRRSSLLARELAAGTIVDLVGFWAVWHLEGGFEGLQALGMSRASIYRRIKLFRVAFGAHPDEFEMPGITLDLVAFRRAGPRRKARQAQVASLRLSVRPLSA